MSKSSSSNLHTISSTRIQKWWRQCKKCSDCYMVKHITALDKYATCFGGISCCYRYSCYQKSCYFGRNRLSYTGDIVTE